MGFYKDIEIEILQLSSEGFTVGSIAKQLKIPIISVTETLVRCEEQADVVFGDYEKISYNEEGDIQQGVWGHDNVYTNLS